MMTYLTFVFFFFSSRRRHTRCSRDWSSDVCSSDLESNTNRQPQERSPAPRSAPAWPLPRGGFCKATSRLRRQRCRARGTKKTHGRCGRGNRAAARRPLADVDSSRWVAEGLTDKEIAKRTPKQSTLPVPPVIPPGEPRGGLLFPLTYELISTKYLLCVPNTTRLPLRSSKS